MSDYRVVFNEHSGRYRVERRYWWGWGFVMDPSGKDYATFEHCRDARRFICERQTGKPGAPRRWRVVGDCGRHGSAHQFPA